MQHLSPATDRSSYYVTVDFFDEAAEPVPPITATWTLTDGNGNIVNQRDQIAIPGPVGTSTTIALSGDDIAYASDGTRADNTRNLTITATYVSTTTGTEMPLVTAVRFMVEDVPGV